MSFPTAAPPTLADYQMSFAGLTLGPSTPYSLDGPQGLDLPGVISGDVQRSREHGEHRGFDAMAGREITLPIDVVTDGTSLQSALRSLASAFNPSVMSEQPLWVKLPNLPVLGANCRTRKRSWPLDTAWAAGLASVAVQVHASDPLLYGAAQSASIGLGTPGGGWTFPISFPWAMGGGTAVQVASCPNGGNFETRPVLTITGPVTSPMIYSASGWAIQIVNPSQGSGYTVAAGDTLVIDLGPARSVTYYVGGSGVGASRKGWVVGGSIWPSTQLGIPGLAPGANSVAFTSQDASAVTGTLSVSWAPAYLI